jgi:hypothetical protein
MKLLLQVALASVMLGAAAVTCAQQAPSSTPSPSTPAASTPAPSATKAPASTPQASSPSAANGESVTLAQKAKDAGMKQETHGGTTYYCWKESTPNSRLPEKRCVNDDQLQAELDRRQARREQFQQSAAPGMASK